MIRAVASHVVSLLNIRETGSTLKGRLLSGKFVELISCLIKNILGLPLQVACPRYETPDFRSVAVSVAVVSE
jgi:hypothetical protein